MPGKTIRKSKLPVKPESKSKKKSRPRKATTKVDCPPIPVTPSFYDERTDMYYRVGPKGGVQRAKSREGRFTSVKLDSVPSTLKNKLTRYSTICKSGNLDDLRDPQNGDPAFIMQQPGDRKTWYAIGRKGGLLVLRHGKTSWVNMKSEDAPIDIRIRQIEIQERLKIEKEQMTKRRQDRKLNTWLAKNPYVFRLDDARLRKVSNPDRAAQLKDLEKTALKDDEFYSLWWDTEANKLLKRSTRSWNLVEAKPQKKKKDANDWNRYNEGLRQAIGVFMADRELAVWKAQHNGNTDGALIVDDKPWIFVKEGPSTYSGVPWYKDFSKPGSGYKKLTKKFSQDNLTQDDTDLIDTWTFTQQVQERKRAKPDAKQAPQANGDDDEDLTPTPIDDFPELPFAPDYTGMPDLEDPESPKSTAVVKSE